MNASLPTETVTPKAKCEFCGKVVDLHRDTDGFGRPRTNQPYRYSYHAGNKWGRPCRGNGEQYIGDAHE